MNAQRATTGTPWTEEGRHFFQELDLHPGFAKFGLQSPVLRRLLSARLRVHEFGVVSSLFLDPVPHRLGDQVVGLRDLSDGTVLHRPPRGPLAPRPHQ